MLIPDFQQEQFTKYREQGQWLGRTLIDYAIEAAERRPDSPVFIGDGASVDYETLLRDAEAIACSLWDLGLRPGDVVGFQLPNWAEAAAINLAACRIGVICNPLVPIYRDTELIFMLNDSKTKAVFVPSVFRACDYAEMYARIEPDLVCRPHIISVRATVPGRLSYEDLILAGRGRKVAWPAVTADSAKLLLYTSGTTGRPKAVLHNHDTLARAIRVSVEHWGVEPGDVVLMPSPVTHATGYANALELPFLYGTRTVLMDRWDAAKAVSLIDEYGVVATVGATPFLKELTAAAAAAGRDLPSLRVFACGGASVPPEVIYEANRVFRNRPAFRVYGASEAPYVALGFPATQEPELAATTDGQIVDYEFRIVDDQEQDVPAGAEGEILVRGPSLFLGYANAADNAACFTLDGYFRTGDIGIVGPRNSLTITGRKKDLIIRGGENISAKEIEDVLHRHPDIAEVAVVSMPHERLGEGVFAFVIARDGAVPTLDTLQPLLQTSGLSRQKHPDKVAVLTDFPRTPSGKVKKDVLRRMAADIVVQQQNGGR